ncbi:metal-dependent transcriptional regulator [Litchfieldia alkalitelluris]|uniref:metal-dependent transcriptional regulator n=1 Tax=Litchfieldia alkalitelluris TaxID=304268 RepID=UPI00099890DE|nr:metal-dependent transcriptional regulator [Litchfieldia alkalitelluris]
MESKTTNKYLYEIYKLEKANGNTTISEIAKSLNISLSPASKMVVKLRSNGYVNFKRYGTVTLTDKGAKIGKHFTYTHQILVTFLQVIGVEEKKIVQEVNNIELNLSNEVVNKIKVFLENNGYIDQIKNV